jgi:hypothetical protein
MHEPPANQVNFVKKIETFFCGVQPWVMVELAFPAALSAFVTIIEPNDKMWIRYLTGGSWLHGIKQLAKDVKKVDPTFELPGGKYVFKFIELEDYASWYLFLGEVVYDAYLWWHSRIYKITPRCNVPLGEYAYSTVPIYGNIWNPGPGPGMGWFAQQGLLQQIFAIDSYVAPGMAMQYKDVFELKYIFGGGPTSGKIIMRNDTYGGDTTVGGISWNEGKKALVGYTDAELLNPAASTGVYVRGLIDWDGPAPSDPSVIVAHSGWAYKQISPLHFAR